MRLCIFRFLIFLICYYLSTLIMVRTRSLCGLLFGQQTPFSHFDCEMNRNQRNCWCTLYFSSYTLLDAFRCSVCVVLFIVVVVVLLLPMLQINELIFRFFFFWKLKHSRAICICLGHTFFLSFRNVV